MLQVKIYRFCCFIRINLQTLRKNQVMSGRIRRGSSPWIALVGGVRWSLGLGRGGHRWRVVGGSASWRCIGGSAGCCLRGYGGWRRSCRGLGLCLGLQRSLWGLLGLEGGERERSHKDQYVTTSLTSAAVVFNVWLPEELLTKTVLGAGVGPAAGAAGAL